VVIEANWGAREGTPCAIDRGEEDCEHESCPPNRNRKESCQHEGCECGSSVGHRQEGGKDKSFDEAGVAGSADVRSPCTDNSADNTAAERRRTAANLAARSARTGTSTNDSELASPLS